MSSSETAHYFRCEWVDRLVPHRKLAQSPSSGTSVLVLSVSLLFSVRFIYFIGSRESLPRAIGFSRCLSAPPSNTIFHFAGASSPVRLLFCHWSFCPSVKCAWSWIGFLLEPRPPQLYLSRCERLTALPVPRAAPAPFHPAPRKEGRAARAACVCHFQCAAKPRCYVTPWDY